MTKLLLDESVPHRLAREFPERFQIFTVQDMSWKGVKNGALLALAGEHSFDALLTTDKNMEYQQNAATLPCPIVVLRSHFSRFDDLAPLVPKVVALFENRVTGIVRIVA